jgi:hypothetical protein
MNALSDVVQVFPLAKRLQLAMLFLFCASLVSGGLCCEPRAVRAVRCASSRSAGGGTLCERGGQCQTEVSCLAVSRGMMRLIFGSWEG